MFTSENKKYTKRHLFIMLGTAAFVCIFAMIYNVFSHEVHSVYMNRAFLIPLAGTVLYLILYLFVPNKQPGFFARQCLDFGLVTLMLGSILQGVFVIAGTNSDYIIFYPIAGGILLVLAVIFYILPVGE